MTDNNEKDVQTSVEAEEMATEEIDAKEVIAEEMTVEEVAEEPKKKGRVREFFKTRKMAIGITVLIVLLVANVSVFGMNKFMNKGFRDHGGKTVEREYSKGPGAERGDKDYGYDQHSEKAPRAEKAQRAEKGPKTESAPRGGGPCGLGEASVSRCDREGNTLADNGDIEVSNMVSDTEAV